ncbi:hypothetical protein GQR58_027186 [Nymphon striatum]|nr:hypothetical protein GQR58_027186 [Nymphon striatum]
MTDIDYIRNYFSSNPSKRLNRNMEDDSKWALKHEFKQLDCQTMTKMTIEEKRKAYYEQTTHKTFKWINSRAKGQLVRYAIWKLYDFSNFGNKDQRTMRFCRFTIVSIAEWSALEKYETNKLDMSNFKLINGSTNIQYASHIKKTKQSRLRRNAGAGVTISQFHPRLTLGLPVFRICETGALKFPQDHMTGKYTRALEEGDELIGEDRMRSSRSLIPLKMTGMRIKKTQGTNSGEMPVFLLIFPSRTSCSTPCSDLSNFHETGLKLAKTRTVGSKNDLPFLLPA